jgi:hypothetical protein
MFRCIHQSIQNLQQSNSYKCTKLTPKPASVVPPEVARLTSETCREFKIQYSDFESESVLRWLRYCDSK